VDGFTEVTVRTSTLGRVIRGSLLSALFFFPVLQAQQAATGTIGGTITDPLGKPVARVVVTLTNDAQGTVRTITTQNDGGFSFTTIEAADYTLAAIAPSGFATWRESVKLEVGQTLNISASLVVAGSQTTVEVKAGGLQGVDTTSSDLGGVISAQQIESLPLKRSQLP
jgi:hypothetical protein